MGAEHAQLILDRVQECLSLRLDDGRQAGLPKRLV